MMKKLLFITFLILLSTSLKAQYNQNITGYNLYWYELGAGQQPPINDNYYIITSDTVIVLWWERGTTATPEYNTPYTGAYAHITPVINSPELWSTGVAAISEDVSLSAGIYEVTVTEKDVNNNESGHSQPLFLEVISVYARVQINLSIR